MLLDLYESRQIDSRELKLAKQLYAMKLAIADICANILKPFNARTNQSCAFRIIGQEVLIRLEQDTKPTLYIPEHKYLLVSKLYSDTYIISMPISIELTYTRMCLRDSVIIPELEMIKHAIESQFNEMHCTLAPVQIINENTDCYARSGRRTMQCIIKCDNTKYYNYPALKLAGLSEYELLNVRLIDLNKYYQDIWGR